MTASATDLANDHRRGWWLFVGVMLLTLLIRGGALWAMRERLNDDPDAYRQIAEALVRTGVYTMSVPEDARAFARDVEPTAYRPPLYPLLLSILYRHGEIQAASVALLHLALGLAAVAVTYSLAGIWKLGRARAVAALLVAFDPILINQSALLMTETLATLLAVVCLWWLTNATNTSRWRLSSYAVAGICLGFAILCRPTFLPWLMLVAALMLVGKATWPRRILRAAVLFVAACVVLTPWVIRNYRMFDQPIVTTTHGGYTLWLGNNETFYRYLRSPQRSAWAVGAINDTDFVHPDFELQQDLYYKNEAYIAIYDEPEMFTYACLMRVGYLWTPLPQKIDASESTYRTIARVLVAIWYCGVYLLAAVGTWKLRSRLLRSPWVWGVTLCLAFTVVHALYWSNLRMRAPLMPVVCLLAGAAFLKTREAHHGGTEGTEKTEFKKADRNTNLLQSSSNPGKRNGIKKV